MIASVVPKGPTQHRESLMKAKPCGMFRHPVIFLEGNITRKSGILRFVSFSRIVYQTYQTGCSHNGAPSVAANHQRVVIGISVQRVARIEISHTVPINSLASENQYVGQKGCFCFNRDDKTKGHLQCEFTDCLENVHSIKNCLILSNVKVYPDHIIWIVCLTHENTFDVA